jgi:hypothetical protein
LLFSLVSNGLHLVACFSVQITIAAVCGVTLKSWLPACRLEPRQRPTSDGQGEQDLPMHSACCSAKRPYARHNHSGSQHRVHSMLCTGLYEGAVLKGAVLCCAVLCCAVLCCARCGVRVRPSVCGSTAC